MENRILKPGDPVYLKADMTPMTIIRIFGKIADCQYKDKRGKFLIAKFELDSLLHQDDREFTIC